MSIVVMVDSAASLPKTILKRKDVVVVPIVIDSIKDIKNLKYEEKITELDAVPIIHRPLKADSEKEIRKYLDNGYDVLYITLSSKLSNHYTDMIELSSIINHSSFSVVDSLNVGSGEALLVKLALEYIDKGYGLKQTCKYINEIKEKIKTNFLDTDFEALYIQDKCEDFKNKYLRYCQRYPIGEISNGEMKITFNASSLDIAHQIVENNIVDSIENSSEIIISCSNNKDFILKLKRRLKKKFDNVNIEVIDANSLLKLCLGDNGISYSIINK